MFKYLIKEQWEKIFIHYNDDDFLNKPSYMPKSKISAPVFTQIILFVVNTYFMLFASRSASGEIFPIFFTIIATIVVVALFSDDFKEWFIGSIIYTCGKLFVIIILLLLHSGSGQFRRDILFPIGPVIATAFIFGIQFVIWCVIKSIKQVKRM